MLHTLYNTKQMKKKVAIAAALILLVGFLVGTLILRVQAEEMTITGWVLCQPGDYVNARTGHSRRSQSTGRFETGDPLELDGKTETVHVKNTGRCRELLVPDARLLLQHRPERVQHRLHLFFKRHLFLLGKSNVSIP